MAQEQTALGTFRILDLAQGLGQYATRLLADLGAEVVRVEPPNGGTARRASPFAGDLPGPNRSLAFLHLNANKRSVVLDVEDEDDRTRLLHLASGADALVEDFSPGYLEELGLGYPQIQDANPAVVYTSVTPFGQVGPHARMQGSDLIAQAMSDWLWNVGDEGDHPCAAPGDPGMHIGGTHGALGTLLALYARRRTGRGQHVDVSVQEAMTASASSFPIGRFSAATQIMRRMGSDTNAAGVNCYPCSDGYAQMNIHFAQLWQKLVEWIDHPVLKDPYWLSIEARSESADVAEEIIKEFTASMTTEEFVSGGRSRGLPVAPVNTFSDVRRSPVLLGRNWFKDVVHPELREISMPGFPWTMSATPPRYFRSGPLLGEHTEDVLQAAGTDAHRPVAGVERQEGPPLKGVRVIDLTRAWAGPFCTRLLADYGAEVIKIESGKFDTQREGRAGTYTELNRNKVSITIDLHHPEGQALVKRLAEQSDVLVNNYRPGTLERFNLGYEDLRKVNPNIIVLSMPGYGSTGPGRLFASHGAQLMADSGMYYIWGQPHTPVERRGRAAIPDFLGGAQGALAVTAALHARDTIGAGQEIEIAQLEALVAALGVGLLDSSVNSRDWEPSGNRKTDAAPYDVYACRGRDAYCAITCVTDDQWEALCRAMGAAHLANDARFGSLADRTENADALDEIITAWTSDLTPRQVMYLLQKEGAPAAVVQTGEDVYFDVHLRERGFVVPVDDPESGPMAVTGLSIHLSETPGRREMAGRPVFGGANDYVFGTLLKLTSEERRRLEEAEAIA
ncbi:MAG: CoA transferase [Chloroflexi bacterium]|nr:CoA transferase [Chloroflexota bacterium]